HVLSIVGPVGGGMHDTLWGELARGEGGELRLHQAALVMPLLRPGIGEEQMNRGERAVGNHAREHLQRVVPDDAYVGESVGGNALEQAADARTVYLDGDEIGLGGRPGDRRGGLAHSRADLQHQGCDATEKRTRIDRLILKFKSVLREKLL